MEDIITSVKRLASNTDEAGHQKLMDGLRDLSYSLETPRDTIERLAYAHLQIAAVRIGIDLKLFDLLATTDNSLTVDQLHQVTRAAPILLGRLLRYLASVGIVKEVGTDRFTSTNITKTLAIPGVQAGVYHHQAYLAFLRFYTCGPQYQELPAFLAKINYQDITNNTNTVHQVAHKTPLPVFPWFAKHPQEASAFNEYMRYRRKDQPICWDVYPVEQEAQGWAANATVLVDMGGNIGHQSAAFKKKLPNVPGHVVLRDLPGPIGVALSTPGVENMTHDIFKSQPIKWAKFYYLRTILHDWSDHKCREILQNIIASMGPDSAILLDEMVLPDTRVHWQAARVDLTMMAALGARERTRTQWTELLDSVGLEIAATRAYTPSVNESIMTVVRKS